MRCGPVFCRSPYGFGTLSDICGVYWRDFAIFARDISPLHETEADIHVPRRGEAGRPRGLLDHAQTGGLGLQPRLPLLLLPRQGGAVRRPPGRDGRPAAGALHKTVHPGQRGRHRAVLLARRRAVAAGAGFLPPGDGAAAQVRRRQTDREHVADQRYAGRRGVVRPLRRQQFPGRPLARRARGYPRRLPPDQGRQTDLRARDADGRDVRAQRRGIQYAERRDCTFRT